MRLDCDRISGSAEHSDAVAQELYEIVGRLRSEAPARGSSGLRHKPSPA